MILANNLHNYHLKENEVILYSPLYNTENRYFRGAKKWLSYIMIQGNSDETFLPYGYNKEKSKVLNASYKHLLPNIF